MDSIKTRILFVSHDASRTGAPILLLNLFKAIEEDYEIHFLLKSNGDIKDEFIKSAPTYFATSERFGRLRQFINRTFKINPRYKIRHLKWKNYDLVISNTITNGNILPLIKKYYKGPIISYVHELEMATNFFTTKKHVAELVKLTDAYFVPSHYVKSYLVNKMHIAQKKIAHLPYFIPSNTQGISKVIKDEDEFAVGGAGTTDWRKSTDLFILIARGFSIKRPKANVKFIWKGLEKESIETARLRYDIKQAGLEDVVVFEKLSSDIASFFSSIDLFILPSREDPYPLVVLEAADKYLPTICFESAGGTPAFIQQSEAGFVIPYLDINSFIEKIILYYDSREMLKEHGERAKAFLCRTHQNKNFIKQKFVNSLREVSTSYSIK